MKQQAFRWLFAILALCFLSPSDQVSAQTDYSVPITFLVTSTGINRFIASQWGAANFTKSWSGETNGLDYSFQLSRPSISLSNNTIKIILGITYSADDGGNPLSGTVTITPTLTIPSTTISASNIIAQYVDLHSQIVAITKFSDSRLKDAIEQELARIDWIVYQGKILDGSTTRLLETADVSLVGIPTLTFSVNSSEILLTVTSTVRSKVPSYTFIYTRNQQNTSYNLTVRSNDKFVLDSKDCRIYLNITGQTIDPTTGYDNVQSVLDPNTGEYVASDILTNNGGLGNYPNQLRIKLTRQYIETLWSLNENDWTVTANYGE